MSRNASVRPPFAVIFDMDGVLIDSHAASLYSQRYMGKKYNFSQEEIQSCSKRGGSLHDFYHALQKLRPFITDFDTFADDMLAANFEYLEKHVGSGDQATKSFLHMLRKHHIPVAIGTSALKRSAARKLALVELHNEFDVLVTADDIQRHKPHPDVYLEAAKRLGMEPAQCVVIEDAEAGIQAGRAAGMKVIGLSKYVENAQTLKRADLIVRDFPEITIQTLTKLVNS